MLYLHVGLHKTGTTYLQECVFPKMNSINLMMNGRLRDEIMKPLVNGNFLISNEGLCGVPWGVYNDRFRCWNFDDRRAGYFDTFCMSMRKLQALFPNARLVLGIREHQRWVTSLYKQYLHEGGTKCFRDFFSAENGRGILRIVDVTFARRIELLCQLFKDMPIIYSLESIKTDIGSLVAQIGGMDEAAARGMLESPVRRNPGVGYYQGKLLRFLNRMDKALASKRLLRLTNPVFRRWKVTPRDICQYRLGKFPKREILMPEDIALRLEEVSFEDRACVKRLLGYAPLNGDTRQKRICSEE